MSIRFWYLTFILKKWIFMFDTITFVCIEHVHFNGLLVSIYFGVKQQLWQQSFRFAVRLANPPWQTISVIERTFIISWADMKCQIILLYYFLSCIFITQENVKLDTCWFVYSTLIFMVYQLVNVLMWNSNQCWQKKC